jgi:nitrate reductase NapE component
MSYVTSNMNQSSTVLPDSTTKIVDPDHARKERAKDKLHKAEAEGSHLWAVTKEKLFQPAVAGGLFSVVNVGVIGGLGYLFYTTPAYRNDYKIIGGAAAGTLLLFGAEGVMAESYLQTPEGQREKQRAQDEGSALYRQTREIVLRPGVFGGLMGLVNVGILGGLGYTAYSHWDEPVWDRRYVAGITAGTLALFTGQGYLAEQYREKEYPKHKHY